MAPAQNPSRIATTVNEYTVITLSMPPTQSFPQPTRHYLYVRPNAPKIATESTARELFVVNLPVDATEQHVRSLFAENFGGVRVSKVEFEGARTGRKVTAPVTSKAGKKRKRGGAEQSLEAMALPEVWDREVGRSGNTAVVTCVDEASCEIAVKEAKKVGKSGKEVVWGKGVEGKVKGLGAARYLAHHTLRFPSTAVLQASVDAYMTTFAEQEGARAQALARQRAVPDEDGFITVVRGGRMGPGRQEEAQEAAEKQKEKQQGADNFYRFQMREKRKETANELLKGFQEDRKKVEEMKKRKNKFRPN